MDNTPSYNLSTETPSDLAKPKPGAILLLKEIWKDFRQEKTAFKFICIYLIFEYLRPHMIYPELDIVPWGKIIMVLTILFIFIDPNSRIPSISKLIPLLTFSICVLLSMAYAFYPSAAVDRWSDFFSWFFVILIILSIVKSKQRLFLFLCVYFFCNLKMAQHGFRTWALGGFGFSGWGVTGSPGWFQNSGEFAMEMGMFLPLVLVYLRAFREDWSHGTRFFFYLLIIMVVGSIIGCSNRGAIIGLITVGLWWLLFSQKRIKALIILISAASIIYLALPKEFKARFETIGKDTTSIARIAYWNASLNAIKENFYLGIGFKNWPIWVSSKHPELKDFDPWGRIIVLHNTYLEVATELGLFGTSAFVLILLQIFFINLRSIRISREQKDPFLEATAKGLIGSLLAYLAPSFFMSVLYYPYVWILLALSICVSSVLQQKKLELGVNHLTGNYR